MPKPAGRRAGVTEPTPATVGVPEWVPVLGRLPLVPWLVAALAGSLLVVLLGWLAAAVLFSVGWIAVPSLPPGSVAAAASQAWLGIHGAPFTVGGLPISQTPLGLSALIVTATGAVAAFAVRQLPQAPSFRTTLLIIATCTGGYALVTGLLAALVGRPDQRVAAVLGGLVLAGLGSSVGAIRAAGLNPPDRWPSWAGGVPRAIAAGLAVLVAASMAALIVAIAAHHEQIGALQAELAPDPVGAVLLVVLYLCYAPNLVLWAGSYVLGAGFSVGADTLLTPWVSQLGLLPALPLAGALPAEPPVAGVLWLISGPLAGVAVAAVLARSWRGASPDRVAGCWRSGLTGLVVGVVWVLASWFARGGLGSGRLAELGPRFPELWGYGTLPIAAGAALAGLVFAELARRRVGVAAEVVEPALS